jgi:N-acetylmuramoyl-L-alanine amidase
MLKSLQNFFSRIFGGKKDQPKTTVTPPEDGADVPTDVKVVPIAPDSIQKPTVTSGVPNLGNPISAQGTSTIPVDTSTTHKPKYLWCLDNGHGKATPGKRSPVFDDSTQLMEYELVRDINRRIIEKIEPAGVKFFNVVPEVEGDIPLGTRTSRANNVQSSLPKIYLSIHANANGSGSTWNDAKGLETWYLKGSTLGPYFATVFQRELIKATGFSDRGLRCHSPASAAFYVLRNTTMPAVLTENGFYTNKEEAAKLQSPAYRQKIADAHVAAIMEIESKTTDQLTLYPKIVEIKI